MKNNDPINYPPHYNWHPSGIECAVIAQAFNYNLGNALKYIWRCDYKEQPVEDLRKAVAYLNREIDRRIDAVKREDECDTTDWSVRAEKPTEVPQTDVAPNHPLEYLKKKADEGDAEAQWILGNAYLFGRGVEKNKEEADRLWKLSQQNRNYSDSPQNPVPQTNTTPLVTKSDSRPNLTGNTLAYAQAGDARRQYEMGKMAYSGDGMPQDYEQAVEWWILAAKQGNYEAQISLVNAYRTGIGVEKNGRLANYWLEQAGSQLNEEAAR
jgi:TPR repeat protein